MLDDGGYREVVVERAAGEVGGFVLREEGQRKHGVL